MCLTDKGQGEIGNVIWNDNFMDFSEFVMFYRHLKMVFATNKHKASENEKRVILKYNTKILKYFKMVF